MVTIAPKIIIDPKIRFGKPTIRGTRITVEEVLGFLASGMDFKEIAEEYDLKRQDIMAVLSYVALFFKGVEINTPERIAV